MTDPAPPARTPLTPEHVKNWLEHLVTLVADGYREAAEENLAIGLALARSGGRRDGLEEVIAAFRAITDDRGSATLMSCGWAIQTIRRLAEDALKAPKTTEIPAGKQG